MTGGRGRRGLAQGGRKRRRLRRAELVCHPGCPPECGDGLEMLSPMAVFAQGRAVMAGWAELGRAGGAVPGERLRSGEGERERGTDRQTDRSRERSREWGQLTRLNFL